jgi:hypothetical protein
MRGPAIASLVTISIAGLTVPAAASPPDGSPASCNGIRSSVDASTRSRDDVAVFFARRNPAGLPNVGQYSTPVARAHARSYLACTALTPPLMRPAHP